MQARRSSPWGLIPLLPLIDIVLLLMIGHFFGTGVALWSWLIGIVVGAVLTRWGIRRAWKALRAARSTGAAPGAEATSGAGILAAGLLLIVPGPITDLLGLALLVPFIRRRIGHAITAAIAAKALRRASSRTPYGPPGNPETPSTGQPLRVQSRRGPGQPNGPQIIDGETRNPS